MKSEKSSDDLALKQNKDQRAALRVMAEANANIFNLKCMAVLSAFSILAVILNEIGLFTAERALMLSTMALAFITFFMPVLIYLVSLNRSATPVIERPWFRKLIITCVFVGTVLISVSLSFHAVIFLAVPILFASQYGNSNRDFVFVLIASILLVPIGVYGSFFFGTPDRNFIKGMLTDEEARYFANRVVIATRERLVELFLHYVMPRMFGVAAIAVLAAGITRRNSMMSEKQIELSEKVNEEMATRHKMQNRVIELLANVIETRDVSTGEHIIHTKKYVEMIAFAMQKDDKYRDVLDNETIDRMINAAPLHDVGKIVVPDTILLKPAKLTPEEFERMKTHTTAGRELIGKFFEGIKDVDFLKTAEDIAIAHHEKWDGSGYPKGLRGEQIPLAARIMAVADVFDALVSVRVYKSSIEPQKALEVIFSESGTHFDPDVIRVVRTITDEMIAVADSLSE